MMVWSTRFGCNSAATVWASNKVNEEKVLQVMSYFVREIQFPDKDTVWACNTL